MSVSSLVCSLSREIIINYNISLSPSTQPSLAQSSPGRETNIQSRPGSSELSLAQSEGQLVVAGGEQILWEEF